MKYLYLGDTHSDRDAAARAIDYAARNGADTVVQVGDWGFLWPRASSVAWLDQTLVDAGVKMMFCDGNHDWHPRLRPDPSAPRIPYALTPNIRYMPRGSSLVDADGTRFLFLGGAPSIDREHRTPGKSWWPEEEITDEDVAAALAVEGPVHVMVTHDSPIIPPGFSEDVGSEWFRAAGPASRRRLLTVMEHHQPPLLVHGHFHKRYSRLVERPSGSDTQIEGLDCNHAPLEAQTLLWSRDMTIRP